LESSDPVVAQMAALKHGSAGFSMPRGVHLGGGSDNINKNVIGERVLGLSAEPRDDDVVPWRDLPR
jgi:hypothetical protein